MSKTLKRIVAVVAVAKLVDKVQEMRRPKRSPLARMAPTAFTLAAAGGLAYLAATGRLAPIIARIGSLLQGGEETSAFGQHEPPSQQQREIRLPADSPTAMTAPTPTTPVTPR